MALPRFIEGRKYWFQNYLEHLRLHRTEVLSRKQALLLGLLLLGLGLARWAVQLVKTSLPQEWLRMAMSYTLKGSDLGLLMTACTKEYPGMSTYGSRLQRKKPKLVSRQTLESGLSVTEVVYTITSIGDGKKGR